MRITIHICRLLLGALALVATFSVFFIGLSLIVIVIPMYPIAASVVVFLITSYTLGRAWIK